MKTTINIDVEKDLLAVAEQFASQHQLSLAQLVESFFKRLAMPQKNVVQLVRELKKPVIDESKDLKQAYYEEQKGKYAL